MVIYLYLLENILNQTGGKYNFAFSMAVLHMLLNLSLSLFFSLKLQKIMVALNLKIKN